jgi:putative acetyltransferase
VSGARDARAEPPRAPVIVVRRAQARDAAAIVRIFDAPNAMAGTLQLPYPSPDAWARRLAETPDDDYVLVAEIDGEVVGNLGLHPASKSPRRRHAGTLGMAVRDDFQRRGVGRALLSAAIDLADNWIGYARLELTVYTDNAAAIALYRSVGFDVEGTARQYALRDGEFVDALLMARRSRATMARRGMAKRGP